MIYLILYIVLVVISYYINKMIVLKDYPNLPFEESDEVVCFTIALFIILGVVLMYIVFFELWYDEPE